MLTKDWLTGDKSNLDHGFIANWAREIAQLSLQEMREAFTDGNAIWKASGSDARAEAYLQMIDAIAYLKFGGRWRVRKSAQTIAKAKHRSAHTFFRALAIVGLMGGHHRRH